MPRQRLDQVLQAVAGSLAQANAVLTNQRTGGVAYLITELDAAVVYATLTLEGDVPLVELDSEGRDPAGRFLRLTVTPVPLTAETQEEPSGGPGGEEVPDLRERALEDSLEVLARAGFSMDRVIVAFDPASDAPAGTIISYRVERQPRPGVQDEVTLVVAGPPPADPDAGSPGGPAAPERPRPRARRSRRRPPQGDDTPS